MRGVVLGEGIGVRDGVGVMVGVGGSPTTVKDPDRIKSVPKNIWISYSPGSHISAAGSHSV